MTTPTTVQVRLQIRADTAANWTSFSPVLLANELGLETDTKKFKIGDGNTSWQSLAYFPSIVSGGTVLGNLEIGTTGTLTFEGSTANGFETTLGVVDPTADRTILLPNQSGTVVVGGNASIVDADIAANAEIAVSKLADGAARQLLQTDAAGTGVEWTSNIDIPGTLDVTGAATFDGAVTVAGDLTVNGTTTTISTQNLLVEDKNIILGDVATPTDVTADGGGITLKGATDKTINWNDSTDAWTSSERFSVPLGSAAAPSLTFTGDPNTGIYSPGADQVAISTGGSGRLFVDSSGNVGVGITPTTRFHVYQTGSTQAGLVETNQPASVINFKSTGQSSGQPQVGCAASDMILNTNGSERLRITSAGLVGVGTSSPNCLLEVKGGSAITTLANSYTNCGVLHQYSSTSLLAIGNDSTSPILQGVNATNNTARNLLLNPLGGSVGIGTSAPDQLLTVFGNRTDGIEVAAKVRNAGTSGSYARYDLQAGSVSAWWYTDAAGNALPSAGSFFGTNSNHPLYIGSNNTRAITVDTSQRVGIGTTTPQHLLDCVSIGRFTGNTNSAASGAGIEIGYDAGNTTGFIQSYNRGSSTYLSTAVDGSDVRFKTSGAEKARIDSSGRLLVGTSSARSNWNDVTIGTPVQIEGGNENASFGLSIVSNSGTASAGQRSGLLILGRTAGTAVGSNTAVGADYSIGQISFRGSDGTNLIPGAAIEAEVDGTPGANDMPGRLVFSVTRDGQASPTSAMRITNSGRTVVLGNTNAFDAYSEQGAGTSFELFIGGHSATTTAPGSGTSSFRVFTNGNVQNTNNSYGSLSDAKLKENIVDAGSQWNDLKSLQVRKYNFKEETGQQTHTQIGLIAQEVELVSPGLVTESPDRDEDGNDLGTVTKSVNYSVLYMKAVKALQEAMERIETLEAKVAALESV